jgi:hypothetical protein
MSIEPLPDELRAMISAEPQAPAMPAAVEARLLARLDASVGAAFAAPTPAPTAGPAPTLVKTVLVFLAGGVVGGLLTAAVMTRRGDQPVDQPPLPLIAVAPPPTPAQPVVTPPPAVVTVTPPAPKPPPAPRVVSVDAGTAAAPVATSTLEQERQLLEPARTALARGMTARALELLERHEREFASGLLAEERDALFVQALSVAGQASDAQTRASRFRTAYPDSLFLPVVERALRGDAGP